MQRTIWHQASIIIEDGFSKDIQRLSEKQRHERVESISQMDLEKARRGAKIVVVRSRIGLYTRDFLDNLHKVSCSERL